MGESEVRTNRIVEGSKHGLYSCLASAGAPQESAPRNGRSLLDEPSVTLITANSEMQTEILPEDQWLP